MRKGGRKYNTKSRKEKEEIGVGKRGKREGQIIEAFWLWSEGVAV